MKKGILGFILAVWIVSVVAAGCSSGGGGGTPPADCDANGGCVTLKAGEAIKIGVGGPMTGDNSAYGIDAFQAAQLAAKDAGDFDGHSFAVDQGDDLAKNEGGVAVANRFGADSAIVGVVGHSFSGISAATMAIYAQKFMPMMSASATRVDLTQQRNPAFNRLVSTDKFQGDLAATFLTKNLGLTKIAIMHDGTDYGKGLAQNVNDDLKVAGVTVVAFEAITPGDVDYSAVLKKIADLKPDAVYFGGYAPEAAVLASQKAAAGLTVPFMSGDGAYGSKLIEQAKDSAEGYYVSQPGAPLSDARTKFDAAYMTQFGIVSGSLTGYTWFAYDATNVMILAVEKVAVQSGDTLYIPRKAMMDAVRGTQNYPGLTGTITCDPNGECATAPSFVVFRVQKGKFVQLPANYKP